MVDVVNACANTSLLLFGDASGVTKPGNTGIEEHVVCVLVACEMTFGSILTVWPDDNFLLLR